MHFRNQLWIDWRLSTTLGSLPNSRVISWVLRAQMSQKTRSCLLCCGEDSTSWLKNVTRHLKQVNYRLFEFKS